MEACLKFIGNDWWPVYEVNFETFPACSEFFITDYEPSNDSTADGDGTTTIIVYEVPPTVDLADINASDASALFAAGFGLSVSPLLATYAIRAVLSMITNRV